MSALTTQYAAAEDGLFAEADLLPPVPPLRLPNNLLVLQGEAVGERGTQAVMALYGDWKRERGNRTWEAVREHGPTHVWAPTIAGPKWDLEDSKCRPVILSLDLRCSHHRAACSCVGDLIYRHACGGCGHVDEPRDSENVAAEDAMDHGWPGWRELPVLATSMPDERKKCSAWVEVVLQHYPAGWLERGGPVRTARSRVGSRHVSERTPHSGYDMGVIVTEGDNLDHVGRPGLYKPETTGKAGRGTARARGDGLA